MGFSVVFSYFIHIVKREDEFSIHNQCSIWLNTSFAPGQDHLVERFGIGPLYLQYSEPVIRLICISIQHKKDCVFVES